VTTFLVYIDLTNLELIIIKVLLSISMNYIAFGKEKIIKNTSYFYLLSIILGGVFYLFDIPKYKEIEIILVIILSPIILYFFIKEYKKYKVIQKDVYDVSLIINKSKYSLKGFLDTGNQLKSPISNKSVILVDIELPKINTLYIPYKALNTEGVIECIKPDKIIINEKEIKNCLIGLSKRKINIEGYHCILPNYIKEEL